MGLSSFVNESQSARYVLAGIIGALLGVVTAFVVNCTLIEISINGFFAVYFGLLFLIIAGIIMWRVKSGNHPKPFVLVCFALLVMASGLLCFVLQKDWFIHLHWLKKVPVYAVLGISVTFALLFALVDIVNYAAYIFCQSDDSRPIIETEIQVYLVVSTAILMGLVFGLVFGLLDIESEQLSHIRVALLREENISYPLGAIIGCASTIMNQYLRENSKEYAFNPLKDELDDDDI